MDGARKRRRGRTLLAAGSLAGTLVTLAPACGSVFTGIVPLDCSLDDGGINPACGGNDRNSEEAPDSGATAAGGDAGTTVDGGDAG